MNSNNHPSISCPFSTANLEQLKQLAIEAAQQAGEYIAAFPRSSLEVDHKSSALSLSAQVVTQVDVHCEQLILEHLKQATQQFELAVLAEENTQQHSLSQHPRLTQPAFWAIDPLDGTLPFIEGGNGCAVSIALINKQGQPLIGVVYLPFSKVFYHSYFDVNSHQYRSIKQQQTLSLSTANTSQALVFYCDRSSLKEAYFSPLKQQLSALANRLGYQELVINHQAGAVVNACSVMDSNDAFYLKLAKRNEGGGSIWDFAATAAIARGRKAWVSDSMGQTLALNNSGSSFMNQQGVLYASSQDIAEQILALKLNQQFSDI
ncbi:MULTISPECIES: 3'(2'),5'-bisphosphate nucleotidase CysQ family protein [unclassified Agarivorans]|uniref:3'(2'),5'-bisphosphate nucleotidase CysQ family protein n=1 Tax=unclassified Agarivorans TaxID=2636026 RepID=UPI0026E13722|nr:MULTISPECIES: inositol monophosphatase family protein [unclassified Agarivorans]MDO6687200.1 inositol monophosphatase family protein [Agarivorans sp. 3_MG-2023]MDO6716873.1 inositol monophosphatase family protein [Agarivorans sp. 2_MG-2023]